MSPANFSKVLSAIKVVLLYKYCTSYSLLPEVLELEGSMRLGFGLLIYLALYVLLKQDTMIRTCSSPSIIYDLQYRYLITVVALSKSCSYRSKEHASTGVVSLFKSCFSFQQSDILQQRED